MLMQVVGRELRIHLHFRIYHYQDDVSPWQSQLVLNRDLETQHELFILGWATVIWNRLHWAKEGQRRPPELVDCKMNWEHHWCPNSFHKVAWVTFCTIRVSPWAPFDNHQSRVMQIYGLVYDVVYIMVRLVRVGEKECREVQRKMMHHQRMKLCQSIQLTVVPSSFRRREKSTWFRGRIRFRNPLH